MSKIKGQFTSLIGLGVFLFIASGNLFGALAIDSNVQGILQRNAGDYSTVAETELKKENYLDRMPRELNFTSNNAALSLGNSAGKEADGLRWKDIPLKQGLKEEYYDNISKRMEEQGQVFGCQSPEVKDLGEPANIPGAVETDIQLNISDPYVLCSSASAEVNISVGRNSFHVNNTNNRYINLSGTAVDIAHSADRVIETNTWSGSSESTDCSYGDARSNAVEGAKNDASEPSNVASIAFDNAYKPDYVELEDSETYFEYSVSTSSSSSLEQCDDDDSLETEHTVRADAEVTRIYTEVRIIDSQREVTSPEGVWENIEFGFNYSKSVN